MADEQIAIVPGGHSEDAHDLDDSSEKPKAEEEVWPSPTMIDYIEKYILKKQKEVLRCIVEFRKKNKTVVTPQQQELARKLHRAVGPSPTTRALLALFMVGTVVLTVLSIRAFVTNLELQDQLNALAAVTAPMAVVPRVLEVRLASHLVPVDPLGSVSTFCRELHINASSAMHITAFEAVSFGYPISVQDPTSKIARSISIYALSMYNSTRSGANFECDDHPHGAAATLLWHWSREQSTRWDMPAGVGIVLPAVADLIVQVDYDATQPSLLQPLQQPSVWAKLKPLDSSGVRLYLKPIAAGSHNASLFASGAFDFTLPPPSSHVEHKCHVDPTMHGFAAGLSVQVFGVSVRTRETGSAVSLSVGHVNSTAVYERTFSSYHPRNRFVQSADFTLNVSAYITTRCTFSNSRLATAGFAVGHELCLAHLYYYPAAAVVNRNCFSYSGNSC